MDIQDILSFLKSYDGPEVSFMEVCGTHTAAISENAIETLISDKIHLISGPGCPVCVTVSSYVDKLCELSLIENNVIVTFGDMIRVPGTNSSLQDMKARGADVRMVYSPLEIISLAQKEKEKNFIFAAVGFETTTPLYAILIKQCIEKNIKNVQLLTALKTMPEVIDVLCQRDNVINGFIAPGHVSVITGSDLFIPLAKKYSLPFVVSGFEDKQLLSTIYALIKLQGKGEVKNLYKNVVSEKGNTLAQEQVNIYFEKADVAWRGLGIVKNSGLILKDEFSSFDAGSKELTKDFSVEKGCRCSDVITGLIRPSECPMFGKVCTPENPHGACMVSNEGSCFNFYVNDRK